MTQASSYRVQVDDDPAFASPAVDATTAQAGYTIPGELAAGTVYHWRICSLNALGSGDWSAACSFQVAAVTHLRWLPALRQEAP